MPILDQIKDTTELWSCNSKGLGLGIWYRPTIKFDKRGKNLPPGWTANTNGGRNDS